MGFIREKTIKGKRYRYYQHNVRRGKKVVSIMTYLGAVGAIAAVGVLATRAAAGMDKPVRYKSKMFGTDQRANKHQEQSNRERYDKEMQNPKERFEYEARKTAARNRQKAEDAPKPSRAEKAEADAKQAEMNAFNEALKSKAP